MPDPGGVAEHPVDRGVAVRLATLALSAKGELRRTVFVDQALRGALLIDLCLLGAIGFDGDVWVDTSPVGYPPADLLLAQMDAQPGLALDHWMVKGVPSLRGMATLLVEAGVWRRQRSILGGLRFTCVDDRIAQDDSYPAMVAADLAAKVGLISAGDSTDVSGAAAWLHQAVLDLLSDTMAHALPTGLNNGTTYMG